MSVNVRLLVGSLSAAALIALGGGYALSRAGSSGGADDDVTITSNSTFQPPTIGTNAVVKGQALPRVTVQTLQHDDFATADLVGQPLVINLWYSTCAPCKQELPAFAAVHKDLGDKVRFVGIDELGPSATEEQFARNLGVQYELYYDTNGDMVSALGLTTAPVTLFVSPDGTIVQQRGELTEAQLRDAITQYLGA